MLIPIDLKQWIKKHPIATKRYPEFFTDCDIDGDCRLGDLVPYTWQNISQVIIERDHGKCRICNHKGRHAWVKQSINFLEDYWWKYTLAVHHIVPREFGGTDHPKNLVSVCVLCHKVIHSRECRGKSFKECVMILKNQRKLEAFVKGDL